MPIGQNTYVRSLSRHYAIVAIIALIAWAFHSSVNHRFYEMMVGMSEASYEWRRVQFRKLEIFEQHQEELYLRNASRTHVRQVFEIESKIQALMNKTQEEANEDSELHEEAEELKEEADEDASTAWKLAIRAQWEEVGSRMADEKSKELAKQAEEETKDADLYMNISLTEEGEGNKRLNDAQLVLNYTKQNQDVPQQNEGICSWVAWACTLVRGNSDMDQSKKASSLAVTAAAEMNSALEEIEDAHKKYAMAKELYERAAEHANESIALLDKAKAFREEAVENDEEATKYWEQYKSDRDKYNTTEFLVTAEDKQLAEDDRKVREYFFQKNNLTLMARNEQFEANRLHERVIDEFEEVRESEIRIWRMVQESRHHVVHACWYALIACIAAGLALILTFVRIIDSIRHLHHTIIREDPYLQKDVAYIIAHLLIFVLSMGFAGDILTEYSHLDLTGRVEIVLLFGLVGTFFQAIMLHLFPNILALRSVSSLNPYAVKTLFIEDVAKRSLAVFLVFGMEVLICWANFGEKAFTNAHRLNRWGAWALVTCAATVHAACADAVPQTSERTTPLNTGGVAAGQSSVEMEIGSMPGTQRSPQNDPETSTLLTGSSGISSLSEGASLWFSVNLRSSQDPSSHYGSVSNNGRAVPASVDATFISSWRYEFERVRILFEALVASWMLYMIRRDTSLIFKLNRMSSVETWGRFPIWILCVVLLGLAVVVLRALRNHHERIMYENKAQYGYLSGENRNYFER